MNVKLLHWARQQRRVMRCQHRNYTERLRNGLKTYDCTDCGGKGFDFLPYRLPASIPQSAIRNPKS